jgi:hypothetical protein
MLKDRRMSHDIGIAKSYNVKSVTCITMCRTNISGVFRDLILKFFTVGFLTARRFRNDIHNLTIQTVTRSKENG